MLRQSESEQILPKPFPHCETGGVDHGPSYLVKFPDYRRCLEETESNLNPVTRNYHRSLGIWLQWTLACLATAFPYIRTKQQTERLCRPRILIKALCWDLEMDLSWWWFIWNIDSKAPVSLAVRSHNSSSVLSPGANLVISVDTLDQQISIQLRPRLGTILITLWNTVGCFFLDDFIQNVCHCHCIDILMS